MRSRKSHLAYVFETLAIVILLFAGPVGASANDPPDPATQPHLKSWSNIIPAARRFVVLVDFNNAAVLDRETGLVWEQAPNASPASDWIGARASCVDKIITGRKGWRLPSVVELASLVDTTQTNPTLPVGHPFSNVQLQNYWTATTLADTSTAAWAVHFSFGGVGVILGKNAGDLFAWCVRGPMNTDIY